MNTKQMKEVALWLQSDNTGSSSKYLLSRIMGTEIQSGWKQSFPSDTSDAERCFKLYQSCEIVRDNIESVYNEMYLGIFPIWKKLFTVYYPVYEKTDDLPKWSLKDETCYLQTMKQLQKIGKEYTIDKNGATVYIADDNQYTYDKLGGVRIMPLQLLDKIKKAQEIYDNSYVEWKAGKHISEETIDKMYSVNDVVSYIVLKRYDERYLQYLRNIPQKNTMLTK